MKHTGKTILTLLLAILMTVGLAGCGSSRSGSGGSLFSGKSPEPVLVRVVATRMEDNAIVSDVHYAYDEYGNQTTKANYQFGLLPNGYSSYEYEYGSGGVPAKRSTYAMAKDFSQLTLEETFDRDGKLTGRREYDNGEIIQEYGYDGSGNMILYVSYSGGEMNYKTESTFDENGDCLTESVTQADGSSDYREYLPYDELNRSHLCSHRVETDADGGETEYDYTIEKDENGYLLTYSIANAATGELLSRDTYVNLYGDNGRLNSIEVTDENGVCTRQEYLRYDEAGNVIQRDSMRDYGTFATRDTFSYAYNDAGVNIQLDYHHYQNNRGEIMESSSVTYYDDQGDMTGYDYETEDGRVSFGIGRVAGKQVVLSKQCTRWNENIRLDFDMVFTGDNEYTEDHTPYDNLDAAFRALDYTRSYTYDDKGNLTAVEEWENGAEMPTQRWDYTYAMPKDAPALHPQAVQLTLGNAPAAVRLYDADDSLLAESFLTYGDDGRCTEMVTDGAAYAYEYEDAADGSYIARQYAPDGSQVKEFSYDSWGNMVGETQYGGDYPVYLEYTHDALGTQDSGSLWGWASGYYAYEYDESGYPTALRLYSTYSYEPGTLADWAACTCDDSGRLIKLEVYDLSGRLNGYVTYEYAA